MWWYPHHDLSWEWMLGMGLMMVVFWGGLLLLGIWLVRSLGGNTPPPSRDIDRPEQRGPDALEILKQRYARGEITRAEFEEMREDLRR